MTKRFLVTAGVIGLLTVILGAIGSHLLSGNIPDEQLSKYDLAGTFAMYHALAILALTFMNRYVKRGYQNTIYFFFLIGVVLFSGTLYVSALQEVFGFEMPVLSKLTPIGGLSLIFGWVFIIISGLTYKHKKRH